jgi:chaperonin GroES
MKLKPLFDKVVITPVDSAETTKSGIVLPSAAQEKPQMAVVTAVGPGGIIEGKEIKMQVKEGDKVLYSKYAGTEFKLDGKEYTILRQSDILAVVEETATKK